MNIEGFANRTNIGECEAACPKEIKLEVVAHTNRDYIKTHSSSARNPLLAVLAKGGLPAFPEIGAGRLLH